MMKTGHSNPLPSVTQVLKIDDLKSAIDYKQKFGMAVLQRVVSG